MIPTVPRDFKNQTVRVRLNRSGADNVHFNHSIDVTPDTTIGTVYALVAQLLDLHENPDKIICRGRVLKNYDSTLEEEGILVTDVLFVVYRKAVCTCNNVDL